MGHQELGDWNNIQNMEEIQEKGTVKKDYSRRAIQTKEIDEWV